MGRLKEAEPQMTPYNLNRFHFLVLVTWQFAIFFAVQQIFPIFLVYVPEWRCLPDVVADAAAVNTTTTSNNIPASWTEYSRKCDVYQHCPKQRLDVKDVYYSAAVEFGWICTEKAKYMISLTSMVQFFGVLCGTIFYGSLADRYGRKPIAILVLSSGLSTLFASGFLESVWQLLVARYLVGLANGGTIVVVCTFVMELLLPQQRMALRAYTNWGNARLISTVISYLLPHWRHASIACSLFALPALVIILTMFPESPPWLYQQNRHSDLQNCKKYIARLGGVPFENTVEELNSRPMKLKELMGDPQMRAMVGILCVMWFTASISSYTNDLNSAAISGDFFLNQVLLATFIAISKVILGLTDLLYPKFNRRSLHHYSQLAVIVCFLGVTLLTTLEYRGVLLLVLNLFGTISIEWTWDACYLSAVESMPTDVRGSAIGSCSLVARIGALMSPALTLTCDIWGPAPYMCVAVFGFANLIISHRLLPDTKNTDLCQVRLQLHKPQRDMSGLVESNTNTTLIEISDTNNNVD